MRNVAERRHQRQKQYSRQRWTRMIQRIQRRAGSLRKVIMRFALLITGSVLLLLIGLALFSPILEIKQIRVSRTDPRIDAENIQRALAPLFGRHLFFLPPQEVSAMLRQAVPDLRDARITKQYPSVLQLNIGLDPIVAEIVIENPDTPPLTGTGAQTGTGQMIVDPEGQDYLTNEGLYAVYNASQVQTGSATLLKLRVVDWAVRPEPWKPLVDAQFLDVMQSAESELKTQFSSQVTSRTIFVRAREFHLRLQRYSLWFDMRSPLPEQLQRYRIFLQTIGQDKATEYVDLRIKDKIVYK